MEQFKHTTVQSINQLYQNIGEQIKGWSQISMDARLSLRLILRRRKKWGVGDNDRTVKITQYKYTYDAGSFVHKKNL